MNFNMNDIIYKKREGGELTADEINWWIDGYVREEIPDYQVSALLMAIFFRGLSKEETYNLTAAMRYSGDTVDLSSIKGIKVDTSHHHHTVFQWGKFTVENHYDFINVYAHRSSAQLEKVFKELGKDDTHSILLDGAKLYLPSPDLHALFLVRHMVSHFASVEINLRQVLDWAFFVRNHGQEVDWEWLAKMLEQYQMDAFFHCINAICVEDLGFERENFPPVRADAALKERVLDDIIAPSFTQTPRNTLKRLLFKFRRWQANAWKQQLCYPESRWTGFWYGIWAKMLKPSGF